MTTNSDGSQVDIEWVTTYVRNGTSSSTGGMTVTYDDAVMEFAVSTSGSWSFQDGYLIESAENTKLVNISHPELNVLMNFSDLIPEKVSDSSEIIRLTAKEMITRSETSGELVSCARV